MASLDWAGFARNAKTTFYTLEQMYERESALRLHGLHADIMEFYMYDQMLRKAPVISTVPLMRLDTVAEHQRELTLCRRDRDIEPFLRAKRAPWERDCVHGGRCWLNRIAAPRGFIGVEWFLPQQRREIENGQQQLPQRRGPCIACRLVGIAMPVLNIIMDGASASHAMQCSDIWMLCGEGGDFLLQDAIAVPSDRYVGLWAPVVRFQVSKFEYRDYSPTRSYPHFALLYQQPEERAMPALMDRDVDFP